MPNRLNLPEDLEKLVEKREQEDRRKEESLPIRPRQAAVARCRKNVAAAKAAAKKTAASKPATTASTALRYSTGTCKYSVIVGLSSGVTS